MQVYVWTPNSLPHPKAKYVIWLFKENHFSTHTNDKERVTSNKYKGAAAMTTFYSVRIKRQKHVCHYQVSIINFHISHINTQGIGMF